jgi:catechol 2,3-dioxygenase-like lactoylglutathione lyase family enzyme
MHARLAILILAALTAECLLAQDNAGLGSEKIPAFLATKDAKRAVAFYRDKLGLRLVREEPGTLVFDANGVGLRIQVVGSVSVAPYTVLGWNVSDIAATVKRLKGAGATLLVVPSIKQDELDIWKAGDGTRVAWFKDPDGHILSVAQF